MSLAPIILFVFNRPDHTKKTIESLQKNPLSRQSDLIVFSDGARNDKEALEVEKVRHLIDRLNGFKNITINKRPENFGLARSVISGVSDVIDRYGKAIMVEDDLQFSPHFLEYMNEALNRYQADSRIFSIGGYSPPLVLPEEYLADSYLSYRCCTWGWATWKDRWNKVDWEIRDYEPFCGDQWAIDRFNRGGEDMFQILKLQMDGKISSWGIRWDYAHFKNEAYCFRPSYSIVGNTGNDGSGIHCGTTNKFDVAINAKSVFNFPEPGELKVNDEINRRFATFYDGKERTGVPKSEIKKETLVQKVKKRLLASTKKFL